MPVFSRRSLLRSSVQGIGSLILAGICSELTAEQSKSPSAGPLAPKQPHFAPRAKRVIFISMRGGPSHVDTFDYKPALERDHGKTGAAPGGADAAARGNGRPLLKSPWKFSPSGKSGLPISEVYPHLARHADSLCLLNGMYTTLPNHPQAFLMLHTGEFRFVRPSVGAWVLYGLGTENQDLPGFVTISPPERFGGPQNYGAAFLPASFQGTALGSSARRVTEARIGNLASSDLSPTAQRSQLDLVQSLNRDLLAKNAQMPELEGAIQSLELGFRMQSALPKVLDLSQETSETLALYGIAAGGPKGGGKGGPTDDFGRQCLLARRLAEAGVRYVEICHEGWDHHGGLSARLAQTAAATDQPIAGLLTDLARRGLLKDTLVVWGGEFGRTPTSQNNDGRDHNAQGFSMWLAGGGVKGGIRYGATDEHGFKAVENRMHINDLHATVLHLLGLDHTRLTYRYAGRDFRLTNIAGTVAEGIFA